MNIVKTAVKRPVGVIIIVAAIIALGIVSLRNLAVDLFPEIDLPVAVVATTYPDAASEDVERMVSRPIEGAVSSIEGIESIQSQSESGSSLVVMMFKNGTDLDQALLDVREKTDQVKNMLPDQAGDPNIIRFSPDQLPVMWVSVSGLEQEALTRITEEQIVPHLERESGVASITVEGATEREIQLILKEDKLKENGLSPQAIAQVLHESNHQSSVGKIEKGTKDLQLRVAGDFKDIEEIRTTSINTPMGTSVLVGDVATIQDESSASSISSYVNDQSAIVLSIMKKTDSNTVNVSDDLHASLDDLASKLPEDVELDIVMDQADFIKLSISSVIQNILIGGAISVIILLLFLRSFRATVVIALSIPIAIVSTFALMYFTGLTLNVLTLGGLALGLGMMVDSSIVILEHIHSYRQRGYSLTEAAIKGAKELAPAVIASTTTTLVVFLPIIYVDGIASDLFTPLALTVSFSLIASLVVAITLVPMLSSKLLSKVFDDHGRRYWFDRFLGFVTNKYQQMLKRVIQFRKTAVFVTVACIVLSLLLIPKIGAELIPSSDQGQLEVRVETPSGSKRAFTEQKVTEVNEQLEKYKDIFKMKYVSIGGGDFGGMGSSDNVASFMIELIAPSDRTKHTNTILKEIEKDLSSIEQAEVTVGTMEDGMGMGSPIVIELNGLDHLELRRLSEDVLAEIKDVEGVLNPESTVDEAVPQLDIVIDEEKASDYGLTKEAVANQIQFYFNGQTATRYTEAGHELDVTLYYPEEDRSSEKDLEEMMIMTESGEQVELSELAAFKETEGPVRLLRQNQQPQINISSDIIDRDLQSVVKDIEKQLDQIDFQDGYSYSIGGQAQDMQESFGDLAIALAFSIFLVYAVMAVQFENFLYPFIIMFAMPTAVIGVVGGLFITKVPLSIPAFIGLIMLAGIVVNNSIVLVDYINILRRNGMSRLEAILHAGPSRLRPILMTTLTTVLGMVPLGLALGEGAETQQPLAIVIIFGLTVSMLFTLLFVPVVYTILDDLSNKITGKSKSVMEKVEKQFD